MSNLEQRLTRCFSVVFPELQESEIPKASPSSVASWDSVATITLTSVVEEEFGVPLDPEEAPELASFALLADHLRGRGVS